jgi:hypothetical protein
MENHIMKVLLSVLVTLFAIIAWSSQALAQGEDKTPTLNPLEVFTCNYLKGKDRGDLDKVITRWNAWTDDNDPAPYTAWVLTPVFFGPEITFDVVWMGAWPTNADMGKSLQTWQDKGDQMNAAFSKVFSCDQHMSMAVMPMQPPIEPTDSALVRFMDCSVADGKNPGDAVLAHSKFKKYMASKGSETNAWLFFPGMGAGKIDFDYKLVLANADYPSLAKDSEIISNGGGWMEANKTFGGIADCDSPRMYQADMVRNGAAR